jgi:hypothetical protein
MKTIKNAVNRAKQSWAYISRNPVWSGVVVVAIVAAVPAIAHFADRLTPASPQPEPLEAAKITGGSWGPIRILYRCNLQGNCVGADHVVFDSAINNPTVGDERYFLRARIFGSPESPQRTITVKPGGTIQVLAFIENNADTDLGHTRLSAYGTNFRITIPLNSAKVLPLIGHIEAENAQPNNVYDTVFLRSSKPFAVQYEWGSARFLSNRTHKVVHLSDNVVGDGASIGYRQPNGIFPATCFCDSGWVSLRVYIAPPLDASPPETVYSVK